MSVRPATRRRKVARAKQSFVCILTPTGKNVEATRALVAEAHALAAARRR